ncbi:MAG: UDP-N-acetylmuramate--L-alanine ligase [Candidatus Anoxychlamydiales bacterium]|nr:UDP-N-acetylmuramate--L-alanine ligase [Candidatus Anoxychlamydiales bacterium]
MFQKAKNTYHFIGIGGIGMSAIAKILLQKKYIVKGSDLKKSSVIDDLKKNGAKIKIGHKKENISSNDIVVISSAIDKKNKEFLEAKKLNLKILHRSDLLDQLMIDSKIILVTGTHGKTTTTSLLTEIFIKNKLDPSFVIGGILNSKNTNAHLGKGKYFIAEADESDGSFINISNKAHSAIVTNLEKEHLDYWKNFDNLKKAFIKFFDKIEDKNLLLWCIDDKNLKHLSPKGISYGFSKEANLRATNIRIKGFQTIFDIRFFDKTFENIKINQIGAHSVLNALSCFGLAYQLKIDARVIRDAFMSFSGVKRRLEKILDHQKIEFFDDYAHHPTEIKATLSALRSSIKERRLVAIFQPHKYSRLKDLLDDFTKSFRDVDELLILDIYSASEASIKNINEKLLVDLIKKQDVDVKYIEDKNLEKYLLKNLNPFDVVVTLGAGDISSKIRKIAKNFSKKFSKKINLGIIYGGQSNEHDISIRSTKNYILGFDRSLYDLKYFKITKEGCWIQENDILDENFENSDLKKREINKSKKDGLLSKEVLKELTSLDVCFPVLHGPLGEDGMIGAFLQTLNIAYVGSDYFTSPIAMDKAFSKTIVKAIGIDTLDFLEVNSIDYREDKNEILSKIEVFFKFPIILKPNHLGSSLGIEVVEDKKDLKDAIEKVFKHDSSFIIEEKINAREIHTAVIGNDYIEIGEIAEMLTSGKFFDFENKYKKKIVKAKIPSNLDRDMVIKIKKLSKKVYLVLKLNGFARIDFFIDKNENILFSEINPIPGYSSNNSTFAKMFELVGLDRKKMVDQFVILALQRNRKNKIFEKH